MFTGIIETQGKLTDLHLNDGNLTFWVKSSISNELKPDQSISHNGVCLTVEEVQDGSHRVTAIGETLEKTNFGSLKTGDSINLERCLPVNGRLDGHFVQGHVDTTATCIYKNLKEGSIEFEFEFPSKFAELIVEKGSICINGISLTAFRVKKKKFTVAVIPYTLEHTNLHLLEEGAEVNLEFDLLGKYILRKLSLS